MKNENTPQPRSLEALLFREPWLFSFYQAVRLLRRIHPELVPVGLPDRRPRDEVVRFRDIASFATPPSEIAGLERPGENQHYNLMTVTFFGLIGPNPSGVLPAHYTEKVIQQEYEAKSWNDPKHALRDWLDIFNHRFISLFYRAWEKYRFYIPYECGEFDRKEADAFTASLLSLVGLGTPALRDRLRVVTWERHEDERRERVLAKIDDLAVLHYGGFFAHRPRSAVALEALLEDFFQLPVRVQQFQGQWLVLDAANQSRLGGENANNQAGINLVAGERVWDVQNKIRIRLGPLRFAEFSELLPDRAPTSRGKAFFTLAHLVRLYIGPHLDFDVQLVLRGPDVPACRMTESEAAAPRLGWNTWISSQPLPRDPDDAVFEGEEVFWLGRLDGAA